jgi:predicted permease
MGAIWQDIRYGIRSWRKAPGFAAIVVIVLALGIAANTIVFSVIETLFFEPFPVRQASELVVVRGSRTGSGSREAAQISYPNVKDLRDRSRAFASLAAYSGPMTLTMLNESAPQRLFGELVTGSYFETLGLTPAKGRFFLPEEDAVPDAAPVLVLTYGAWLHRFNGAPDIIGRSVRINGVTFSVIGVAPDGFKGLDAVFGPDVWIPTMMAPQVLPAQSRDWLENRSALAFQAVGRLKPGVTRQQASSDLTTIAAALEKEYPDANRGRGITVDPLTRAALADSGGISAVAISAVLLMIPGLILLIACSNVANLLLARAVGRRPEIAVRLALGAGRGRLVRQLLTESVLLAAVSGLAGFGLALLGGRLLWSFRPPEFAANLIDLHVNGSVMIFAALVSLTTALIFGIVPAWQSTRTDVVRALNETARSIGRARGGITVGKVLLAGQVALSLVSLITAGLLVRSLQHAYAVDPGFETRRLGIALISPGQVGYSRVRTEAFYRDVRARLAATPGIVDASWATHLPLFGHPSRSIVIPGREERDRTSPLMTVVNAIDLHYFATTGIPLTEGRDFADSDREGTASVAIVNETLAVRAWPGLDPMGREFRLNGDSTVWRIVGVSKTANYGSLGEAPQPCVYLPLRQAFSDAAVLYVRTEGDPEQILSTVQRQIRGLDSRIDVGDVRTIQKVIGQALFGATAGVGLLGTFGLIALALATFGLYGAMSHNLRQRRREVGLRMALGARRRTVVGLMLREEVSVVGAGMAIGIAASFAVGAGLSRIIYGVTAADPLGLLAASAVLAIAATTACALPAYRASGRDPQTALRET